MGERSKIEWTATHHADGTVTPGHTFNPWIGCDKVSEACKHCYAEVGTYARTSKARGLPLWGATAHRHVTSDSNWHEPLRWNRAAAKAGVRAKVFCASLADVFEDRPNPRPGYAFDDVLGHARARLWKLIYETPHLDWLLLTKRPENADRMAIRAWGDAFGYATHDDVPASPWMPNIWLGTTVENQARADERIPFLLDVPAVVRFLSIEPLLGPLDLSEFLGTIEVHGGAGFPNVEVEVPCAISWVIVGGESGGGARPFHIEWMRSIVRQCREPRVAVFCKQLGAVPVIADPSRAGLPLRKWPEAEWPEGTRFGTRGTDPTVRGSVALLADRKGGDPAEWPADLRVRQFPAVRT